MRFNNDYTAEAEALRRSFVLGIESDAILKAMSDPWAACICTSTGPAPSEPVPTPEPEPEPEPTPTPPPPKPPGKPGEPKEALDD